jgi:transketolase
MQGAQLQDHDARLLATTLRMLAVDAVEQAQSGHPGMPMGAADYAAILWHEFLRFDPDDPRWPDRDRFVLSAGHGSMLLYGLLHLYGYDLALEDLRRFRQLGSRTPGHPEWGHTPGVEVTTGPLGQGFANGVGMAMAGKMAASRFATGTFRPIGYRVFGIVGDGDLMEGISAEAASLAGHLQLGNLIYLYDDNSITIEGATSLAWSEDVRRRFESYGWQVQKIDGHDITQIRAALCAACADEGRPSLIICRTTIAHGSPGKAGSAAAHGAPLGKDEVAATRAALGWPDESFHIPERVLEVCRQRVMALQQQHRAWKRQLNHWRKDTPERARRWDAFWHGVVPTDLARELLAAVGEADGATRSLSGRALNRAAALLPALVGGSADLAPSNNSWIEGESAIGPGEFRGRNLHFGVREHAMAAILNGMALAGGWRPYGATFLSFADYCRPALRMAALMRLPVVYLFTHDSVFVGEDGPTHQPVEQLASLRLIPHLRVLRPADGAETALAWSAALARQDGPTALILTRQKVPRLSCLAPLDRHQFDRGAYLLVDCPGSPDLVLMASGSEVGLAVAAAQELAVQGIAARVLSMPCLELFMTQSAAYRRRLLPGRVPRVAIEAGRGMPWGQLLGSSGLFIGIEDFGVSAPDRDLATHFGLTASQVTARICAHLRRKR